MMQGRTIIVLLLLGGLSGCAEYGYRMNELSGLNCRPEVVQKYGSCVATKGATK